VFEVSFISKCTHTLQVDITTTTSCSKPCSQGDETHGHCARDKQADYMTTQSHSQTRLSLGMRPLLTQYCVCRSGIYAKHFQQHT